MLAVVFALMLQQTAPLPAATGQVVWETPTPVEAAQPVAAVDLPLIPDSARADPYGYERAECSPLIRSSQETLEALADALGCEPADLLMRDPSSADPIWSVWDRVPATKRNDALRVLAAFAEDSAKTGT